MAYGRTASQRREAARKHARDKHTCPRCGREVYGNGYQNHKRACEKRPPNAS
jgi:ribosomal protein L37AE/L43A